MSNAALQCRHIAPSSSICLFSRLTPPERSCFTKRLVNISVRTRRKRRRGGGGRKWKNDKRQEKTICASVVSASSVWVSKGPLCSPHNEERRLRGRKQRSLPLLSSVLCLVFILLRITRSGERGGVRRGKRWEEKVGRRGKRWRGGGGGKMLVLTRRRCCMTRSEGEVQKEGS